MAQLLQFPVPLPIDAAPADPGPDLVGDLDGALAGIARRSARCWQCRECHRWEPVPWGIHHRAWCRTGAAAARRGEGTVEAADGPASR